MLYEEAVDKEQLKRKRASAVMIELDLGEGDRVVELIARDSVACSQLH